MFFNQLEKSFNKALQESLIKKKIFFSAPFILLCGLFFIFCQTISLSCGAWMRLFLLFFPIFLSFGVLLMVGVVLIKAYDSEVKQKEHSFKKIVYQSYQMILNIAYLALPFIVAYMCLWLVLGLFYLIKSIPFLGSVFGPVLSFVPFLLILVVILLTLSCLFFLFFATPEAILKTGLKVELFHQTLARLKKSFFSDFISLCVGLIPAGFSLFILLLSQHFVSSTFFSQGGEIVYAMEAFFVMIPFCLLMTPSVVFFFNFSAECFLLEEKEIKEH
jgi:hypothetical protein